MALEAVAKRAREGGFFGSLSLVREMRTHRRVRRWVQAKMVLTALKRQHGITTYVA